MTRDQAELLVATLAAAWPWAAWPDGTVMLWRRELEQMNAEWATEIVTKAVRTLERPPSLATIWGDYRRRERRDQMEHWRGRELPEARPTREENLEHVGELVRRFWPKPEEPAA